MAREEGVRFGADRQAWDRWERGIELEGGRWEAGTVGRTNGRNLKFKQAVKASKGGNGGGGARIYLLALRSLEMKLLELIHPLDQEEEIRD